MKKLLISSYWIGIVADAMATVLLFFPAVAKAILQPQPFEMSAIYLYVARVAGALMLGWTTLLFWAVLKPIERADILLITLVPVVSLLAVAAGLVAKSHEITASRLLPMFGLYFVLYCTLIPSYVWAKKQDRLRSRESKG
jgi:predicted transporter